MFDGANNKDITLVPMILHRKLVEILEEAGKKRGKSVQQLISEAILEKADALYNEDHPSGG